MTTAYLNRIATAVPAHDVHRTFIEFAETMLSGRHLPLFKRMAERGQIEHRFSSLEPSASGGNQGPAKNGFFRPGAFPSTASRMKLYEREAPALAAHAVEKLSDESSLDGITHLIVVTCTGFAAPGVDQAIIERFGLSPSVERISIGFMGCAASLNALKTARHIVRSEPSAKVLIVSIELCTLHLQDGVDLEQLLCFLIFGDGCAAAVVSAEPSGFALDGFFSQVLPTAATLIKWGIGDQGFDMVLSGRVPAAIGVALGGENSALSNFINSSNIDLWAVHPGGRSVLDSVEQTLELPCSALESSRSVLREFGNMSSATILFVLERLMAKPACGAEAGCALAFGPGLTVEAMQFKRAA
jgi:alpha-pyrone synthase